MYTLKTDYGGGYVKTVMAGTGTSVDQIKKYIRYECESSIQKARLQSEEVDF